MTARCCSNGHPSRKHLKKCLPAGSAGKQIESGWPGSFGWLYGVSLPTILIGMSPLFHGHLSRR